MGTLVVFQTTPLRGLRVPSCTGKDQRKRWLGRGVSQAREMSRTTAKPYKREFRGYWLGLLERDRTNRFLLLKKQTRRNGKKNETVIVVRRKGNEGYLLARDHWRAFFNVSRGGSRRGIPEHGANSGPNAVSHSKTHDRRQGALHGQMGTRDGYRTTTVTRVSGFSCVMVC